MKNESNYNIFRYINNNWGGIFATHKKQIDPQKMGKIQPQRCNNIKGR